MSIDCSFKLEYKMNRYNFEELVFGLRYFILNLWRVIGIKNNE
ncbi:hypothetical protein RRG54_04305 [Mycoplasmopsis felis]